MDPRVGLDWLRDGELGQFRFQFRPTLFRRIQQTQTRTFAGFRPRYRETHRTYAVQVYELGASRLFRGLQQWLRISNKTFPTQAGASTEIAGLCDLYRRSRLRYRTIVRMFGLRQDNTWEVLSECDIPRS